MNAAWRCSKPCPTNDLFDAACCSPLRQAHLGSASAAGHLVPRSLLPLTPAAAAGSRTYASSALEKLQEAAQKVRATAASSASAVKAAGSSVSRAPDAIYKALPASAQQLVNAAQVGGQGALKVSKRWKRRHLHPAVGWG